MPEKRIISIVPATGFVAAYQDKEGDPEWKSPVAFWALVEEECSVTGKERTYVDGAEPSGGCFLGMAEDLCSMESNFLRFEPVKPGEEWRL